MKRLMMLAAVSAAGAAFAGEKFELKGDAARGVEKYTMFCVSCHGEKGDGNGPAGAALTPKPTNFTDGANAARLTDEYVYKMVKDGGAANGKSPMMIAWGSTMKDDELRHVSAYVLKLKGKK